MKLREEEFYYQYHQHGGTTIIPTEIFNELYDDATEEIERLNNIIKEQNKELELERKSRQLLTDDLANVCEISLKKENIIKEVREIFKDYGEKEDIVGYTMYNITGEMLLKLLEILDKVDKENNNESNIF